MDRGAWWATVHGVAKSWTRLNRLSMHTHEIFNQNISFVSPYSLTWQLHPALISLFTVLLRCVLNFLAIRSLKREHP